MLAPVLIFLVVLSLLVFIHELGHFLAAKAFGAKVEEFGFGFPPRVFGKKVGDTTYSINWIPLGGFVRIKGENGTGVSDADSFSFKKPWQRAIILAAGVFMNLILAWFLVTIGYIIGLPQTVDQVPKYAHVTNASVVVITVLPDSPAAQAGLKEGDQVVSVDGANINNTEDFRVYTSAHSGQPVNITTNRDGVVATTAITPIVLSATGRPGIGVGLASAGLISYPWYYAPIAAVEATASITYQTISGLLSVLRNLIVGQPAGVQLSGPIGIAFVTADVVRLGFRHLLQFAAILSINLAVINVLPIPALDGGRLLFLAIEKLRGRPTNRNFEGTVHAVGFFVLIGLILVITYGDLMHFGGRIITAFTR